MQVNKLPSEIYQHACDTGVLTRDPAQLQVVAVLDRLHHQLCAREASIKSWAGRMKQKFRPEPVIPGLYLWGDVGRGKTYLLDVFFASLPLTNKRRMHFYRFMHWVHQHLATAQEQGQANPLVILARDFSREARVLCFDEFFVDDVTDAMILAELVQNLLQHGVTLVMTSNIAPRGLYHNGVHRDRFLPAIDLIERHTEVLALDGGCDYRLRILEQATLYFTPLDATTDQQLLAALTQLAPERHQLGGCILINDRELPVRGIADDVLWCDFNVLCREARGQYDYIELAKLYHAVLISDVIQFTDDSVDALKRFISLVDEFYDHNVKLILSAAVPIDQLYQGERLAFQFARTQSRLLEMQSEVYLARSHNP